MKKRLCFLSRGIFLLCLMLSSVVSAQNVHIPDPIFKNYLLNNYSINTNNDSEIQLEEALAYKGSISIYDAPVIKDLTGLEAFENFTFLVVSGSLQLTNPHLDFSNFRYLMSVSIQESNLSSIKLPNNDYFERITLHKTEIENLDLSGFASLRSIMVDNNARLKTINLKGIDISKIYSAWFMLNPNLYCIQVDDIASAYPLVSKKEIYTKFSLDCSQMPDVGAVLDIPNLGTKHLLLTNTQLNTNGDAEIQVSEAENYNNEELYLRDFYDFGKVTNNDLSWINHFKKVKYLRTGLRHQNVLDLSQVTIGERLTIADANSFEEIILPTDSKLINLTINQTLVENLDLSQQKKLESLSFYSNFNLKNIDFGPAGQHIGKLKHIDISKSPIESIIFNPNPDLNFLGLVSLQLKDLDISALTNLKHLIVEDIKLPSIDLSKNIELEEIEVNSTNIENFDFRTNTKLSTVNIHAPFQVTSDNVIQSLALWQASADALDFSNLNALESLYLNQLNGEHLNLSNLPNGAQFIDIIDSDIKTINLKALDYNKIPYVNLVKNYFLTCILVDDVDLANNMNNWYKEDWNVYTTDCANIPPSEDVVNFIDKPLKKSFLQNDEINLNKDNEIQISEAEAYDYGLYFSAQDIMTETSWLPAFKNVRGISFGEVNIKDINLSGNLEISYFTLFRNDKIEQIDLSKNTKLFEIAIETNPNLEYVNLGNFASKAETTYLWMSANPKLKCIQVDNVEDAKQKVAQEDWYFESIDNPEDLFSTTCFATLSTNAVNKEKIMLYPNPVSSVLNISKAATVLIYNTVGQLVKSEKNTSSVDVSNFNSGVYYIMLLDNNGKVIQKSKIIKN